MPRSVRPGSHQAAGLPLIESLLDQPDQTRSNRDLIKLEKRHVFLCEKDMPFFCLPSRANCQFARSGLSSAICATCCYDGVWHAEDTPGLRAHSNQVTSLIGDRSIQAAGHPRISSYDPGWRPLRLAWGEPCAPICHGSPLTAERNGCPTAECVGNQAVPVL